MPTRHSSTLHAKAKKIAADAGYDSPIEYAAHISGWHLSRWSKRFTLEIESLSEEQKIVMEALAAHGHASPNLFFDGFTSITKTYKASGTLALLLHDLEKTRHAEKKQLRQSAEEENVKDARSYVESLGYGVALPQETGAQQLMEYAVDRIHWTRLGSGIFVSNPIQEEPPYSDLIPSASTAPIVPLPHVSPIDKPEKETPTPNDPAALAVLHALNTLGLVRQGKQHILRLDNHYGNRFFATDKALIAAISARQSPFKRDNDTELSR